MQPRSFWLVADAELIVHGTNEPMASLSIGHQEIPLGVDCTFRVQVSFRFRGGVKRQLSKVSLLNLDAISREGLVGGASCQRQLDVSAALLSQFHALAVLSIAVGLENEQLCSGAAAAADEPEGQGCGQQGRASRNGAGEHHHLRINAPTFMSHLEKR